jgi:hypothetical protein
MGPVEDGPSQSEAAKDEPEPHPTVRELTEEWRSDPRNWAPPTYQPPPSQRTYWFRKPWVWWLGSGLTVLILGLRLALVSTSGPPAASTPKPAASRVLVAPKDNINVTADGTCEGSGVAAVTNVPAIRAVGLSPLERVSIRDQAQTVTEVFTFESAPPMTIPGTGTIAFISDVGSGVTNAEGHSVLIVASGGPQLPAGWTSSESPPGGTMSTPSSAVVDTSARTLTATFHIAGLTIPFLWDADETITPRSLPANESTLYVCPATAYSG